VLHVVFMAMQQEPTISETNYGRDSCLYQQGNNNTSMGHNSLQGSTTMDVFALKNLTSAIYNVGIGYQAGINNTTGNYNTIIGPNTGLNITTNNNWTFLGASSIIDTSGNTWGFSTAIGQNAKITASNQIVLGGLNSTTLPTVYIPSGKLTLGGTYRTGSYNFDLIGNINSTTGIFDNGVNINTIYQPISSMNNYY